MKIEELENHKLLELPKSWKSEGFSSYYNAIIELGKQYLKLLEGLDESEIYGEISHIGELSKKSLIAGARKVYQSVIHTLRIYLSKGDPYAAYQEFDKFYKYDEKSPRSEQPLFYIQTSYINPVHYRLRVFEGRADKSGIFHVPFNKRDKIASNRYSIPGFPTLYLSNSIYTAYKELGEPDNENLFVSKFEFVKNEKISESLLDLTYKKNITDVKKAYLYLASWPLIMACTIKVNNTSSNFKPEYILPQIIFQWIKNNISVGNKKLIGVKYTSTKFSTSNSNYYGHFYNTAIPAQIISQEGYCPNLINSFIFSKPINFYDSSKNVINVDVHGQIKTIDLNGAKVDYVNSNFGKIEEILSNNNRPVRTKLKM